MNEKANNIFKKIQIIQNQIGVLVRTEENKFQKYFFFNELQVMQLLKPLLYEQKLIIFVSDDPSQPFTHETAKNEREHYIKYLKKLEIIDTEETNNKLTFNFWSCGNHNDLAKAKGASDTYSFKYMLSKLFLIPVKDNTDPDYETKKF